MLALGYMADNKSLVGWRKVKYSITVPRIASGPRTHGTKAAWPPTSQSGKT